MNATLVTVPYSENFNFGDLHKIKNANLSNSIRTERTRLINVLSNMPRKFYPETAKCHAKRAGSAMRKVARRDYSTILGMFGDGHDFDEEYVDLINTLGHDNFYDKRSNPFLPLFEHNVFYSSLSSLAYEEDNLELNQDSTYPINIVVSVTQLLNKRNIERILLMTGQISKEMSSDEKYDKVISTYLSRKGLPNLGPHNSYANVELSGFGAIKTKEIDMEINMDMGMEPDRDYFVKQYKKLPRSILQKYVDKDGQGELKTESEYCDRMKKLFYYYRNRNAGRFIQYGVPLYERSLEFSFYDKLVCPKKDRERFILARDFAKAIYRKEE